MRSFLLCWLVMAIWLSGSVGTARAEITGDQVQKAIDKAIKYLKSQQKPDGSWDEQPGYPYGVTSLVTLALLNAGVPPTDPVVAKSLLYLRTKRPDKTYTLALQTMVLCAATPSADLPSISRNANLLSASQITGGGAPGGWSYAASGSAAAADRFEAGGDNSNAQFALLALHEAELAGAKVNPQVWQLARKYWESQQSMIDGSWGYHPNSVSSGSMTCAGISSMIIALGHTTKGDAEVDGERVRCCGQQQKADAIERGLEWLGRNFSVKANPIGGGAAATLKGTDIWRMYYLYGLERVGRMSARRMIGAHDWYREGADVLVSEQDGLSGSWQSGEVPHGNSVAADPNISTSFALLFLSKGRRPVVAAKLKYGTGDDWNHHRSDLMNLTTYTESKWQRPLTYQVFDIQRTDIDDLLQAPVLYFNGSTRPEFTDKQIRLLRDYVDRGGFIFAEATCPNCHEFHEGMLKLVQKMFPEPEYGLKLLPPEHPIWHAEEIVPPKLLRPLYAVDYGCRTCLMYSPPPRPEDPPGNLSCYWELGHLDRDQDRKISDKVREQVQAAFSIGINVLAYATNRDPKFKDMIPRTTATEVKDDDNARGKVYVANIRHAGGCDVAPAALPNMLKVAGQQLHMQVGVEQRQVALTDKKLTDYPLIFMHGRSGFHLSKGERDALRKHILEDDGGAGGALFADAICANKAFAASFRAEMQAIFPQNPLVPIPPTDSLLTTSHGGYDLSNVKRREPQTAGEQDPLKVKLREGPPELEGIKIGDRYAVIFSPYDLSCALEKHQSLECEGYIREDAERIAINVIAYFLQEGTAKETAKK